MEDNLLFFRSKRSKYVRSLVSSGVFAILSIKLFLLSGSILWMIPGIFFILAGIASFIPLLPNQSYLHVHKMGITIKSMFRTIEIKWNEVENFYAERKNMKDFVAFRFNEKKVNYMNLENIYGKNERLPDDYGLKADELADLLEYYRIRFS